MVKDAIPPNVICWRNLAGLFNFFLQWLRGWSIHARDSMWCHVWSKQIRFKSARIFSGIQELCSKIHEGVQQISGTLLQYPWKSSTYFPAIEVSKHCKVLPKNSYISKNFVATLKPWWLSALLQEDGREERASPRLWASSTSNTTWKAWKWYCNA